MSSVPSISERRIRPLRGRHELFRVCGHHRQGKRKRGRIQAESKEGALAHCAHPASASARSHRRMRRYPSGSAISSAAISPAGRMFWLSNQDFATLLGANLPVDRALRLSARQATPRFRPIQQSLVEGVVAGRFASEAMRAHSGIFADAAIEMVKAGELSGTLAAIFERIATPHKASTGTAQCRYLGADLSGSSFDAVGRHRHRGCFLASSFHCASVRCTGRSGPASNPPHDID